MPSSPAGTAPSPTSTARIRLHGRAHIGIPTGRIIAPPNAAVKRVHATGPLWAHLLCPALVRPQHSSGHIKRFYDDKPFAVKAYQAYDKQATADVERFYDGYARANLLERVPIVRAGAVSAVIEQQTSS